MGVIELKSKNLPAGIERLVSLNRRAFHKPSMVILKLLAEHGIHVNAYRQLIGIAKSTGAIPSQDAAQWEIAATVRSETHELPASLIKTIVNEAEQFAAAESARSHYSHTTLFSPEGAIPTPINRPASLVLNYKRSGTTPNQTR